MLVPLKEYCLFMGNPFDYIVKLYKSVLALLKNLFFLYNKIMCNTKRKHGIVVVSTVTSQREGSRFEPRGQLGPFCMEFAASTMTYRGWMDVHVIQNILSNFRKNCFCKINCFFFLKNLIAEIEHLCCYITIIMHIRTTHY